MKLKQILLTSIAALSLSGSLYGMDADRILQSFAQAVKNRNEVGIHYFLSQKVDINAINPYLNESGDKTQTALDYAMEKMDPYLVRILLMAKSNVNAPGTRYLSNAIQNTFDDNLKESKEIIHLLCTAGITIDSDDENSNILHSTDNQEILTILQNHINSRLAKAISKDDNRQIKQIITKYNIDINQTLPYYPEICNTWTPSRRPDIYSFIPLHMATVRKKNNAVHILINECNANVTITNKLGQTVLHHEVDFEIAQLLITKGCNPNSADNRGKKPIDYIHDNLTPNMIEINPNKTANFRKLKTLYGGDSFFSWKLIGGGAVVVVAAIAAKKLYTWWYKEAGATEETSDADTEHTDKQDKDTDKNKIATLV